MSGQRGADRLTGARIPQPDGVVDNRGLVRVGVLCAWLVMSGVTEAWLLLSTSMPAVFEEVEDDESGNRFRVAIRKIATRHGLADAPDTYQMSVAKHLAYSPAVDSIVRCLGVQYRIESEQRLLHRFRMHRVFRIVQIVQQRPNSVESGAMLLESMWSRAGLRALRRRSGPRAGLG